MKIDATLLPGSVGHIEPFHPPRNAYAAIQSSPWERVHNGSAITILEFQEVAVVHENR